MHLANYTYKQTIIKEIELLPKETYLEIDVETKELTLGKVKSAPELSVPLDSKEGMEVLDSWQKKWAGIYRAVKARTNRITVDLSGGFDTRIVLAIVLCSGIDLNDIRVNSAHDGLHTHAEDYAIAGEIASRYGFKLNKPIRQRSRYYNLECVLDISFFTKIFEHKEMHFQYSWAEDENFVIGGKGGEALRGHWVMPPDAFMKQCITSAKRISQSLAEPARKEIADTLGELMKDYHFDYANDPYIILELYKNARCRSHFGTEAVENFCSHRIILSPLLDNSLRKLKLTDENCQDADLLYALTFKRYRPDLLNFRFDSGRSFAPATLEYAEKLSAKYPIEDSEPEICRLKVQNILPEEEDLAPKLVETESLISYLKNVFLTDEVKSLFGMYFDKEIYDFVKQDCEVRKFFPLRHVHSVIAVTLAIAYCMRSRMSLKRGSLGILDAFNLHEKANSSTYLPPAVLKSLTTARLDIKNEGSSDNDIEIQEMSDGGAIETTPTWFNQNGIGHVVTSTSGKLDMCLRCKGSGALRIFLRGSDVKDEKNNRVPVWVYYKNFKVNDKILFNSVHPICHDVSYNFKKEVMDGEFVTLHAEWNADAKTAIMMGSADIENKRGQINAANAKLKETINPKAVSIARLDIQASGSPSNDAEVLDISDAAAEVEAPVWMRKNGSGRMVKSEAGSLSFKVKCKGDGKLTVTLKGDDVRNAKGERIPVWINYTKLSVDGKTIFDSVKPAWHDKPQKFTADVKDAQILGVQVEWAPDCTCVGSGFTMVNSEYEKVRKLAKEQSELMAQQRWYEHELKLKLHELDAELQVKKEEKAELEEELLEIRSGMSFKLGRILTYIPRKLLGKK